MNRGTKKKEQVTLDSISSNAPKENIRVNKEFDKNGNVIKYDSAYSYYYSNIKNNPVVADSIFNKFRNHLGITRTDIAKKNSG